MWIMTRIMMRRLRKVEHQLLQLIHMQVSRNNQCTCNKMANFVYLGIFFSKDRKEEVIEIEEEPELVKLKEYPEPLKLISQGQWMKGCPEGSEQTFLFGQYSELSEDVCVCPENCGYSISRKKSDFLVLYVRSVSSLLLFSDFFFSPSLLRT